MSEIELVSATPDQTRAIGAAVARALTPGDVVMLSGDLGAGKTCFVQGAAEALGVRARVQSPSFVLVREYPGSPRVVHIDVYRLNSLQELLDLGYEDLFDSHSVTFVEWGDAVSGALPDDRLEVEIRRRDVAGTTDDVRALVIRGSDEVWSERLTHLAAVTA